HQARRRGLVAADRQHDSVERIPIEHLDETQVREISIQAGGRPLARFLDRVDRELERDSARFANTLAYALREHNVMTIAWRQIIAGLRNADDGLARLQLLARQTVVQIPLYIESRHIRIGGIVEPGARPQRPAAGHFIGHGYLPWWLNHIIYPMLSDDSDSTLGYNPSVAAEVLSPCSQSR